MRIAVIDGARVPLEDCAWVLRRPCGCVTTIVAACTLTQTIASEDAAWDWFHLFWDPERPQREQRIRERRSVGWTVELLRNGAAVEAYHVRCPHKAGGPGA